MILHRVIFGLMKKSWNSISGIMLCEALNNFMKLQNLQTQYWTEFYSILIFFTYEIVTWQLGAFLCTNFCALSFWSKKSGDCGIVSIHHFIHLFFCPSHLLIADTTINGLIHIHSKSSLQESHWPVDVWHHVNLPIQLIRDGPWDKKGTYTLWKQ